MCFHRIKQTISDRKSFYSMFDEARSTAEGRSMFYILDVIDQKTSSLLTHVSVMVGVVSFLFGRHNSGLYHYIYLAELVVYLIVTLGCLRAIFITNERSEQSHDAAELLEANINETDRRRRIYILSLDVTIKTTFVLVLTLIIESII